VGAQWAATMSIAGNDTDDCPDEGDVITSALSNQC
jgi:hypothetical protein